MHQFEQRSNARNLPDKELTASAASPSSTRPTLPGRSLDDPVLVALGEAEHRLQAAVRAGLDRQQFQIAQALGDALQACQEVVKACRAP